MFEYDLSKLSLSLFYGLDGSKNGALKLLDGGMKH